MSKEIVDRTDAYLDEWCFDKVIDLVEDTLKQKVDIPSGIKSDLLGNLGRAYLYKSDDRGGNSGLIRKAREAFEKALFLTTSQKELNLENQIYQHELRVHIAECNRHLGDDKDGKSLDRIIDELLRLEQRPPTDSKNKSCLWGTIADAYLGLKNYSKTIEYQQKVLSCLDDDRKKSMVLCTLANSYCEIQDFAKSVETCRQAIDLAKGNLWRKYMCFIMMGNIYYIQKQFKRSRDWLLKALKARQEICNSKNIPEELIHVKNWLGNLFFHLKKHKTSRNYFLDVIPLLSLDDFLYPQIHFRLGNIYAIKKQWPKTIIHYENVLKSPYSREEEKTSALRDLGDMHYLYLKKYPEAIKYYEELLKLNLDSTEQTRGDVLASLGNVYLQVGQSVRAVWTYKKVIDDNLPFTGDTRKDTLRCLIGTLLELKNLDEAKQYNDLLDQEYGE